MKKRRYKRYEPTPNKYKNGKAKALATTPTLMHKTSGKKHKNIPMKIWNVRGDILVLDLLRIHIYYICAQGFKSRKRKRKKCNLHFNPLL